MDHGQRPGLFRPVAPLILASGSPRRRELLAMLGLEFQVEPAPVLEPDPLPREAPGAYALRAARTKGRWVAERRPSFLVVAADTVVALDGEILGKPTSPPEAVSMLRRLCGREHRVHTGCYFALLERGVEETLAVESTVRLRRASTREMELYVATGEPMDKAGAYGVQGIGGWLVEEIRGSCSNVIGLPLSQLMGAMAAAGVLELREGGEPWRG